MLICAPIRSLMQFHLIDSKSSLIWLTLIRTTFRLSIRVFSTTSIGNIALNKVSLNTSCFGTLLSIDYFPLIEILFISSRDVGICAKDKILLEIFLALLLCIVKSNIFPNSNY